MGTKFKIGGYRPSTTKLDCEEFGAKADGFVKLAATLQTDTHLIPEYTPISDQKNLSSCVGNSVSDSVELLKGLEDPTKVEQVSRLFVYFNARNYINETNKDEGCFIHDALDSLKKLGVCRESTWQYDTSKVLVAPGIEAYKEGNDNTIVDFYQITSFGDDRLKDIETAIRSNHPVVYGTEVGTDFENYVGGNIIFNPPKTSLGGHAMILVGVRTESNGSKSFYTRNSWSASWGDNGHAWLSADYIKWEQTNDLFVPTRIPDFLV